MRLKNSMAAVALVALAGCGGGSPGNSDPSLALPSAGVNNCALGCHSATRDKAGVIAEEWALSTHAAKGVDCESCHGNGGAHWGKGPIPYPDPDTALICRRCHTSATLPTHFIAQPYTSARFGVLYSAVYTTESAGRCKDCHNPHRAGLTINRQWASSVHGNARAAGWTAYGYGQMPLCMRCHSPGGIRNYLSGTPMAANGITAKEPLSCYGCHEDYSGKVAAVPAIRHDFANAPSFTYPDVKQSNLCLVCHAGFESGQTIKNTFGNFSTIAFPVTHRTVGAAGIMYRYAGYEFAGRDYSDGYNTHRLIGIDNYRNKGTRGPCVSCHLSATNNHSFNPVFRTPDGTPVDVVETCRSDYCHWNGISRVKNEGSNYLAAMEAFRVELEYHGYTFSPDPPFFATRDWLSGGDADKSGNSTGKNNMGAAYNYMLCSLDKGAYAHGGQYTNRLIYDSIDWLDDNLLNDSVQQTISTAPRHAGKAYRDKALYYLQRR